MVCDGGEGERTEDGRTAIAGRKGEEEEEEEEEVEEEEGLGEGKAKEAKGRKGRFARVVGKWGGGGRQGPIVWWFF